MVAPVAVAVGGLQGVYGFSSSPLVVAACTLMPAPDHASVFAERFTLYSNVDVLCIAA